MAADVGNSVKLITSMRFKIGLVGLSIGIAQNNGIETSTGKDPLEEQLLGPSVCGHRLFDQGYNSVSNPVPGFRLRDAQTNIAGLTRPATGMLLHINDAKWKFRKGFRPERAITL